MKKLYLILTLALFVTATGSAQKNIDPTPQDIATAKKLRDKHSKDDVAILSSIDDVTFDFDKKEEKVTVNDDISEQLMNINHRADIHKYEFYDGQSNIEDFSMSYRNHKPANFKVNDEFYSTNDLFYNDYRVKYMTVDFPVQGYIYNYKMVKNYKDVKYFTSIYFSDEFPVVKKEINITVPNWLEIEIKEFNFDGYKIVKTQKPDPKSKGTTYTYKVENLPAMVKEAASPGPSYLYPHLLIIAKSYTTKEGEKKPLFNSTADLYGWYRSLIDSMDENPEVLKAKVKELTANAKTDEEKIKNIYYWVQDNIRYIAFEDGIAGFKPDASQNVFQKKYGDCKGMANLTRQMLKTAGFDARLTWIGTKRIAYDYSIPSLSVDNHMICTLFKDGKKYFLDGTEKFNSFGEYAERIQGKEVLIENGDKYIVEKVPVAEASKNKETYTTTFTIKDETLNGKVKGLLKGESRASFLYGYNSIQNDKKENALQSYITHGDKNFTISNIVTSDLKNRDIPLTIEYDTQLKNKVSSFDNEMYIDLDYLEEFSHMDFKERKTDYEFSFKKDYEFNIELEIPSGYKVTAMPQSFTSATDSYTMNLSYSQKGNKVIYTKHFIIKNGSIKTSEFEKWNQDIANLKNIYNDQITLTKI